VSARDVEHILELWFAGAAADPARAAARVDTWFGDDPGFDADVRREFGAWMRRLGAASARPGRPERAARSHG
jgi:uncharacterized protein (DUF924 family)